MDARRNLIVFNASQGCEKLQEHLLLHKMQFLSLSQQAQLMSSVRSYSSML